jgi:predicted nucleic acid-binding OB-fold protein
MHTDNTAPEPAEHRRERHLLPIPKSWALEYAAFIDAHRPGFLAEFLRTKPVQRHAVLAVLGQSRLAHVIEHATRQAVEEVDKAALTTLGDLLLSMRPREIIEVAFGDCPDGLLGAFERMRDPLDPDDYCALVHLLADESETRRHRSLRYIPALTSERLNALLALDDVLCATRIARKTVTRKDAQAANHVLAVVREHRADLQDSAIVEFANQADPMSPLAHQLERLLTLVQELPPADFQVPKDFIHLRRRSEFEEFGAHHGNCLATKFDDALSGRLSVLIYRRRPAIAVLVATNQGWFLGRVHAPRNAPPPLDLVEEIRTALAAAGIPFITPAPVRGPLATVRRLQMPYDPFGVGPDEFGDWEA